ncbi:unnamed protein product [Mytilus edulis]|uniref:Uncharacterized protein n=1 Tax=Mytilus edulis TaxID=6550 RepID=A0A8S3QYY0_MYTED|nr:unnamed protein product [Mytilus edulis]
MEERRHMNKKILDTKSERLQERHKASYRVLDKNVKRMARADKRAYMKDLAKQAEEAAEKGEQEKSTRSQEKSVEVLNRPPPDDEAIVIEAVQDLEININLPDKQEIIKVIKSLKNGKSPGHDNLNAELFKVDPELAAEILQSLFTSIWEGKIIPDDWTKGIIIKLRKDSKPCNSWFNSK